MLGPDALEIMIAEAEDARHLPQIVELGGFHLPVGLGDMEQAVEQLFQDGGLTPEHARHLPGIGLESKRRIAGLVEDAGDILHLLLRHAEDLLEGIDLVPEEEMKN